MSAREELFRELFEQYYSPVVTFFVRRGFSSEEGGDLAQDTFARAFGKLESLRDRGAARSWLFAVAINVHRNELRSRRAAKRSADEVPLDEVAESTRTPAAPDSPGDGENALSRLLSREREEMLRRALDELPPRMREAVYLRVGRDLKYQEIAVIQQVSVDTIKAQMLQARKKLRSLLGEHFSNIDF